MRRVRGRVVGWTPDGRIAFDSVILNPLTGDRIDVPGVRALGDWSPDGRFVLAWVDPRSPSSSDAFPAVHPGEVSHATELIDITTGKRQRLSDERANIGQSALWLPDGQSFLVSIETPPAPYTPTVCSIWKVGVADLNQRALLLPNDCRLVDVSDDGHHAYTWRVPDFGFPEESADLYRVDLSSGEATMLVENIGFHAEIHESGQ